MSGTFDPYLRWLGIRDPQRPPNHYRLLGLDSFEHDAEIISEAADRQMGHIRTHQSGKFSEISQRLLNELARAKVCLLNPTKKAAYDSHLRAAMSGAMVEPLSDESIGFRGPGDSPVNPLTANGANSAFAPAAPIQSPVPVGPAALVQPPRLVEPSPGQLEAPSARPAATTGRDTLDLDSVRTTVDLPPRTGGRPAPLTVTLTVLRGAEPGQTFSFNERGAFTVGRSRQATFVVQGDQALSRVHFSVKVVPPCCFIKNLSETHATMVNGRKIVETLLRHGDVVSAGKETEFRVDIVSLGQTRTP
jgi:hypothetical protein